MTVPESIRKNVIRNWLEGIARDLIAANYRISVGMVSGIVTEARDIIGDIDLLRELALNLRKSELELKSFAFTVRLQNKLDILGISEDMAESAIEKLHIYCFTKNIEVSEFLSRTDYLIDLTNRVGIRIEEFDKYINEKIEILKRLEGNISKMAKERNELASIYKTTVRDLEEFQTLKPIHEQVINLRNELGEKDKIIQEKDIKIKLFKDQLENLNQNYPENDIVSQSNRNSETD
ncbi:MAG TPA: hypothetical protein VJP58_09085 [Candidatus Nitrosocosmicus sp.]|nr:hypothetical protein [Candidatus Nitrosocosmicus sp.]